MILFSIMSVSVSQCFHVFNLINMPVKRTVAALEHVLGKLIVIYLSSMLGFVFGVHFLSKLEREIQVT